MSNAETLGDESTQLNGEYDQVKPIQRKISEVFGENKFSLNNLKDHVSESTYEEIKGVILRQQRMDFSIAEHIAEALIKWKNKSHKSGKGHHR